MLSIRTHEFVDVRFAYTFSNLILLDQGKVFLSTFFYHGLLGQRSLAGLVSEDKYKEGIQ